MTQKLSPFIQWVGGKSRLIKTLDSYLPSNVHELDTYIEPFIGSGAMLFHILNNYPNFKYFYINDKNEDVFNVWNVITTDPISFLVRLSSISTSYLDLPPEKRKEYYLKIRGFFNDITINGYSLERAVCMVFLNKTGFNGLYRLNSKGKYNVAHGMNGNPTIFDKDNIMGIYERFKEVDDFIPLVLTNKDFKEVSIDKPKSLVYLDPPYRPLTKTANFTSYNKVLFNDKDQTDLAEIFNSCKNACIMETNSDPTNVDDSDSFFTDLYSNSFIHKAVVRRNIAPDKEKRGKVKELIITNYDVYKEINNAD